MGFEGRLGRWTRAGAAAGAAVALVGIGYWLGSGERTESPAPAAIEAAPAPPPPAPRPPAGPRAVALPIDSVSRLAVLGGSEACALGGRRLTCTSDAGATWGEVIELPEAPLAAVRRGDAILAAAVDGAVYRIAPGEAPAKWAEPPHEVVVVDAAASEGRLWLLAHRFDQPADELLLPRVVETLVLTVEEDGEVVRRGGLGGYAGERILVEPGGALLTWAPFDRRAWRSTDGGASLRRLPDRDRFGADFGGLQVAVERRADRLPGRQARPASTLLVSRDGSTWETALEAPGDLLVDFTDAATGLVVVRGQGVALLTTDGGASFRELWRDDRLDRATALAHLRGGFLATTAGGLAFLLPVPDPAPGE